MREIYHPHPDELLLKDSPWRYWLFNALFVGGGAALTGVSIAEWDDIRLVVTGVAIGIINFIGGLLMFWQEPASRVLLSRRLGIVLVKRYGLFGVKEIELPLETFCEVDVEWIRPPSGGTLYRPRMLFDGHEPLPVSMFWRANKARCVLSVQKIMEYRASSTEKLENIVAM